MFVVAFFCCIFLRRSHAAGVEGFDRDLGS